jgi:dTDP-4-amino-4,6-dideoxygalactose transaminase
MIPLNKPYMKGKEVENIKKTHLNSILAGDGLFTQFRHKILEQKSFSHMALLTTSCTHILEMATILLGIKNGDVVIMSSYAFVSTANAFVLRGATIIFVDISSDTMNIDETKIEKAITEKTKVIVSVHYVGVACVIDNIMSIANRHNIFVVEGKVIYEYFL